MNFPHDSESHSSHRTQELSYVFDWNIMEHSSYSPDVIASDFHLFGSLKKHLEDDFQMMQRYRMLFRNGLNITSRVFTERESLNLYQNGTSVSIFSKTILRSSHFILTQYKSSLCTNRK